MSSPTGSSGGNGSLISTIILFLIIVGPIIYFSIKWYITSMEAFRAIIEMKTDLQALNSKIKSE
jgi:hypothetical protein